MITDTRYVNDNMIYVDMISSSVKKGRTDAYEIELFWNIVEHEKMVADNLELAEEFELAARWALTAAKLKHWFTMVATVPIGNAAFKMALVAEEQALEEFYSEDWAIWTSDTNK